MITVEISAQGYDFRENDRTLLNSEFSKIGYVRAEGQWAPAAGPPIALMVVLTFFGQALASAVIGKLIESAWNKFRIAWENYRIKREEYSHQEPELGSIRIRTTDLEIQINMPIHPDIFNLNTFLELVVNRLSSNQMPEGTIRKISLPSRKDEDGCWERIDPEEYCENDNEMVWWMQGSSVDGPWFFYDAEGDKVLRSE